MTFTQFISRLTGWWRILRHSTAANLQTPHVGGCEHKYQPQKLEQFLNEHYDLRFNVLSETTEMSSKENAESSFIPLEKRALNTMCITAQKNGIACWDRDLARYIQSSLIKEYHPFSLYLRELPEWDGVDRALQIARRVTDNALCIKHFRRWLLALTAQWMGVNRTHANSMAPLLISSRQGMHKSTFCKSLVPDELQAYYTDQTDLSGKGNLENKLALMGLINLDEFDRLSVRQLATLKNLMQLPALNIRKAYQRNFKMLPRIASFIGTSNRKDLLTDPTGSRRFLCIEIDRKIDCSGLNLPQLYAQLKSEIKSGERYWFTSEDEQEIQQHNTAFYQISPEEELFRRHFRRPTKDEPCEHLALVDILEELRLHHRSLLHHINLTRFGSTLLSSGIERIHTRSGNRYKVVRVKAGEGCEG